MKNIEALIDDGGDITLGALARFDCVATDADGSNCLAMLVRPNGETLNALRKRLDKAIGLAWSDDVFIDEVNDGRQQLQSAIQRSCDALNWRSPPQTAFQRCAHRKYWTKVQCRPPLAPSILFRIEESP